MSQVEMDCRGIPEANLPTLVDEGKLWSVFVLPSIVLKCHLRTQVLSAPSSAHSGMHSSCGITVTPFYPWDMDFKTPGDSSRQGGYQTLHTYNKV
jgi:hypothetical protein